MSFDDLQQFVPKNGEKIILVENGKPTTVLISFEDYRKMTSSQKERYERSTEIPVVESQPSIPSPPELIEKANADLTLEDLPF